MGGVTESDGGWVPRLEKRGGKPVYQAIADAIADDIRDGILAPGVKLPPLRVLAEVLGLDFTTVSRAYNEAGQRGLVIGKVGQGTFVLVAAPSFQPRAEAAPPAFIDMSMNAPPLPADPRLRARMRQEMAEAVQGFSDRRLRLYGDNAGSEEDRAAGLRWLGRRLPGVTAERLLLCPGAQGALLALLTSLVRPGDTVLAEELTYPGLKAAAAQLGLHVIGVDMDGQGMLPDAFRAACERHAPKALYSNPTLHNPTTTTLPVERRVEIVEIARRHGVAIIEDDAYGMLSEDGPPPLAAIGPDMVFHVAGLAKCLSPALRIAYLVVPDRRQVQRLAGAVRATMMAASPIGAAIATRWIESGLALDILAGIRAETRLRRRAAADILPAGSYEAGAEAFHLWLRLPDDWSRAEFVGQLRGRGVSAAAGDAFAAAPMVVPEAVRLCLGVPADEAETRGVLTLVADLLDQPPAMAASVV